MINTKKFFFHFSFTIFIKMSATTKKKHVTREVLEEYALPEGERQVVKVCRRKFTSVLCLTINLFVNVNIYTMRYIHGPKLPKQPPVHNDQLWSTPFDFCYILSLSITTICPVRLSPQNLTYHFPSLPVHNDH